MNRLTLIYLFCGCGGVSAGFVFPNEDNGSWEILAGLDNDLNAVTTFRANFGEDKGFQADLTEVNPATYLGEFGLAPGDFDHLHASPPCEDYAVNNYVNGRRTDLRFRVALAWVEALLPKVVSIENVRNLEIVADMACLRDVPLRINRPSEFAC